MYSLFVGLGFQTNDHDTPVRRVSTHAKTCLGNPAESDERCSRNSTTARKNACTTSV